MNAIECENLTRKFGRHVVIDHLNLTVPTGSIFALLGSNGAGKTTTIKLLLNLLRPTSGRATVLGCETTRFRKAQFQRVGYVAEDQIQPDWMTLPRFLAYYRAFYPKWDHALENQLRAQYRLPEDRPLKKLSRGMRMKAILLSTLSFRPELLLLDEPFSGLDPQVRDDLIDGLLETVGGDSPSTVVISSHDIAEVERLADWVGILAEGRLVLAEPIVQLQARFRRVEVVGPAVVGQRPLPPPPSWLRLQSPSSTVVQFVHQAFADADQAEAEIHQRFPGAALSISVMSLREIFLVCSQSVSSERKAAT